MAFRKYSQMKLQMKREELLKLNSQANELGRGSEIVLDPEARNEGLVGH